MKLQLEERTLCKVHDFIFVQSRNDFLVWNSRGESQLFASTNNFFWFWFSLRVRSMMSNCDILSRFFFISLGVSPSTANVSAVQKKQLIQVNLGHHVRLNCHHHPTFDKWRPHTKWKKNVKWFKNGRRLRPKALPKNISIKNKR